jgi:hypothetical protein
MGISIAYQGKLRDPGLVPALVADLKSKAESAGWLFKTMDELVAEGRVSCTGLEGITLYPHPECEPLQFHFDREGVFTNHHYYMLLGDSEKASMFRDGFARSAALTRELAQGARKKAARKGRSKGDGGQPQISASILDISMALDPEFIKQGCRYNWTKTQFAGPKVHAAVCAILRYVKEIYAPELEIKDDSGYFVHGDEERLEAEMGYQDRIMSLAVEAIQDAAASSKGPMTLDKFVERINEELAGAKDKLH